MNTPLITTVTGPLDPAAVRVADAHTHVWIENVGAITPEPMILDQAGAIGAELREIRAAGVDLVVDCQPGGCGRNGAMLRHLSQHAGIAIVASTGFHLRHYYPADAPIFSFSADAAAEHFTRELRIGLTEDSTVRAGVIKTACESTLAGSPLALLGGAVTASLVTGAAIEVHTERGADAEAILRFMLDHGLPPVKLILCHMDKRPDAALHRELAGAGVMLEYDTFLRPRYQPEQHVWVLLDRMLEAGFENSLVLATDLADARMWRWMGGTPGAIGILDPVRRRLETKGLPAETVHRLTGGNIARTLAL